MDYFLTPEITEFVNDNFSLIGRALALATNFERTLKMYLLALSIKFKKYFMDNIKEFNKIESNNTPEDFIKIIDKITFNRAIIIVTDMVVKDFPEFQTIKDQLLKAKQSRNYIAHELCIGYYNFIDTDDFREKLIDELKEKLLIIIECTLGLEIQIRIFNKESTIIELTKKSREILKWAIEVTEY